MEYSKNMKKISGDSVTMSEVLHCHPTIYKTIGGATYIARMHFDNESKIIIEDKLIRLMGEAIIKLES